MSPSTVMKDLSLKPQTRQTDQHIPAPAGFMFVICLLAGALGTFLLTQNGILSETWVGVWTFSWVLLGTFFLLAIKIAAQWEKGDHPAPRQVPQVGRAGSLLGGADH